MLDAAAIRNALDSSQAGSAPGDPIYLDYNATAPLRREVLDAMRPFLEDEARAQFGNPESLHRHGQRTAAALEQARKTCAEILNCAPEEIIFTSGGTESNRLALFGAAWGFRIQLEKIGSTARPVRIVHSAIEHSSVRMPAAALERQGFERLEIPAQVNGQVAADKIQAALDERTALVAWMYANNETGVVQPVDGQRSKFPKGCFFLIDAVQAPGRLPLDVQALGCDGFSISAHKFYGPKGVGLLYLRKGATFDPPAGSQGQEGGRRGGTHNVAGIVGLAAALRLAENERVSENARLTALRITFEQFIRTRLPHAVIHGTQAPRLANTVFVSLPNADGNTLVHALDLEGVSCSTGAACSEGVGRPSHVLVAMGLAENLCASCIRFSLGRGTTEAELARTAEIFAAVAARMKI